MEKLMCKGGGMNAFYLQAPIKVKHTPILVQAMPSAHYSVIVFTSKDIRKISMEHGHKANHYYNINLYFSYVASCQEGDIICWTD